MHVHADFESLYKEVPKRLLPQEYGGEAGPLEVLIGECGVFLFCIYRVSQEECARLREGVPYVKVYRYNPKHLSPTLNGYGDNGQRRLKV